MAAPHEHHPNRIAEIATSDKFKDFQVWLEKTQPTLEGNHSPLELIPDPETRSLVQEYGELLGMPVDFLLRSLQGNLLLRKLFQAAHGAQPLAPPETNGVAGHREPVSDSLSPEIREWALALSTEEEVVTGLRDLREHGGSELGEVIAEIEREMHASERSND